MLELDDAELSFPTLAPAELPEAPAVAWALTRASAGAAPRPSMAAKAIALKPMLIPASFRCSLRYQWLLSPSPWPGCAGSTTTQFPFASVYTRPLPACAVPTATEPLPAPGLPAPGLIVTDGPFGPAVAVPESPPAPVLTDVLTPLPSWFLRT